MILAVCEGMTSWVQACQDKICIPGKIASLITTAYNAVLIAVPLLLIISGMITLAVSITKQKEDDIKKAQQLLVKKLIAGAIVFLLLGLVKWMISYFKDESVARCFDALINYNKDSDNCYYDENGVLQGGDACNGPSSLEFGTADYQCQAAGADGAILLNDADNSIICYTKDTKCCKCTGTVSGTPFWGRLENEKNYRCYCAVDDTVKGAKVKRATTVGASGTGDCN